MHSKTIHNQVKSKVLPGNRACPDRVLTVHRTPFPVCVCCVSMCTCVYLCSHTHECTCECLCTFTCIRVHEHLWVWGREDFQVCVLPELYFPRGGHCQSALFLLGIFCVPTSEFLEPLLWNMSHFCFSLSESC